MADRNIERLKEQIKFETEVLKFTALVMVATAGGSVSLVLGEPSAFRLMLAGLGFLSTLALAIVCWRFYVRVGLLIAQIMEASS